MPLSLDPGAVEDMFSMEDFLTAEQAKELVRFRWRVGRYFTANRARRGTPEAGRESERDRQGST